MSYHFVYILYTCKLVVIKDYESVFNAVTLKYKMISEADFLLLSIAKINNFHQQSRFYRQMYHSVNLSATMMKFSISSSLHFRTQ